MWSISCNTQRLAQQQGQHTTQWSMLRKRTFHHFQSANRVNWQSSPHFDVNMRMNAREDWRQKGSERWVHCAAYNLNRSVQWRKDRKRTFYTIKRKRTGSRNMWREKPLWQEYEFQTPRQRLCMSWKIWLVRKARGRQPESPKERLKTCWMLLETLWAILQGPTMFRMGKTRKMMKKIQSLASWVVKMNLAGWWAQSPKQYSTAWRVFSRSRWGLTNWPNQDEGTHPTTSVRVIWSMELPNRRFRRL